jgi:hypothetical protein
MKKYLKKILSRSHDDVAHTMMLLLRNTKNKYHSRRHHHKCLSLSKVLHLPLVSPGAYRSHISSFNDEKQKKRWQILPALLM